MWYCGLFHLNDYYSSEVIDLYNKLTNCLILILEKKIMIKMIKLKEIEKEKKKKNRKQNWVKLSNQFKMIE